jgi:hypothetical protein
VAEVAGAGFDLGVRRQCETLSGRCASEGKMTAAAMDAGAVARHRRDQKEVANYHQCERGNYDPGRTFSHVFHGPSPLECPLWRIN